MEVNDWKIEIVVAGDECQLQVGSVSANKSFAIGYPSGELDEEFACLIVKALADKIEFERTGKNMSHELATNMGKLIGVVQTCPACSEKAAAL